MMQRAAAAGTLPVLEIDHDLDLRQALRQLPESALPPLARGRVRGRRAGLRRRIAGGLGLFEILERQRQLIGIQLFGALAEAMPLQLRDQQMQLVDLGPQILIGAAQAGILERRVADQVTQNAWVIGKIGRIDRHAESIANSRSGRQ
ncbi:MAG TPA: hypothetical protein VE224_17030 [Pseudolabrys sp.]|nr:hypothetical protein [Pseudolabrys sp.]